MDISRFINRETIELEVEFLTPCFLGGADQNAELRAAPFKYLLRQWWRILYGDKYTAEKLLEEESKLFGSTGGAAKIVISIEGDIEKIEEKKRFLNGDKFKEKHFSLNILDYLAYGKFEYIKGEGNNYIHSCLSPGQTFILTCTYPLKIKQKIETVLYYASMYGTLGSRSRNGFGSFQINNLDSLQPENIDFSKKNLNLFPAINKDSQLFVTKNGFDSWEKALSKVGLAYKDARTMLENRHSFERRGLLARPIEVKGERNIPYNIRSGRHPKHFFLSVIKQNNKYYGQIITMPILFYENNNRSEYEKVISDMHKSLAKNSELKNLTSKDFKRWGTV